MKYKEILKFLLIYYIFTQHQTSQATLSKRKEEILDREHRRAICCAKKMRCCTKTKQPPIEIRAILARCPNRGELKSGTLTRQIGKPMVSANEHSLKSFQGFDEDEPLMQSRVLLCQRKILMTLKMHHKGTINTKNQYIVIDHVYDPSTEKSVRLLNPYVIKLRQEQVSKAFLLKFVDYVNSEAKEQVYNKHDANFTGCYTDKARATCGVVKYDGKVIPYSEGFCCSCDSKKNAERQPESINEKNEAIVSFSDPAYLLDHVQCPRNYYKEKEAQTTAQEEITTIEKVVRSKVQQGISNKPVSISEIGNVAMVSTQVATNNSKRWQYTTYSHKIIEPMSISSTQIVPVISHTYLVSKNKRQDAENGRQAEGYFRNLQIADRKKHPDVYIDEVRKSHIPNADLVNFEEDLKRRIRQTFPSGVQKRGGQNCANRFTPPGLDPEHYHESAHCLRFSDVWYGIYKLGEPFIEHGLSVSIYERFETEINTDKWREITNGSIRLSNRQPLYEDETPTISIFLTTKTLTDEDHYASLHSKRILIPEGVKSCDTHKYPEMRKGADEYLVVNPSQIAIEGDQCDEIGVGFEAFTKQPQRCGLPRGTCLHNQPKNLWKHDKAMEKRGKKGCYFLKYHANITSDPILINQTTGDKYLDVEYTGAHISNLDIEIKADFNAIIRKTSTAVITEIYIDSTCEKISVMTIKVINTGLISNKFMVALSDFPLDFPETFNKIKSKLTLISPQNQHIFTLEIRNPLPTELLYCSVEVLNGKHELVALRRARIQKYDRCICTWHCLCACVASSDGLKCLPMSIEHYHAAGFQGSLPMVTHMMHLTLIDDLISVVFYFGLFLLTILLLMGIVKAMLGFCCLGVGMWGLDMILDLPKRMKYYYEPNLRHHKVIYDERGWPLHPFQKYRVRNISRGTEFCTNVVFFFTYPLASCMGICRRLCCTYYTKEMPKSKTKPTPLRKDQGRKDKKPKSQICPSKTCPKRKKGGTTTTTATPATSENENKSDGSLLEDELSEAFSSQNVLSAVEGDFESLNIIDEKGPSATKVKDNGEKPKKKSRYSKILSLPESSKQTFRVSVGKDDQKLPGSRGRFSKIKPSDESQKPEEEPEEKDIDDKKKKKVRDKKPKSKVCFPKKSLNKSGKSTPTSSNPTVGFVTKTTGSAFLKGGISKYHGVVESKGDDSHEGQGDQGTSSGKICQCKYPKPISTTIANIRVPTSSYESTSKEIRRRRRRRKPKSESTSFTSDTTVSLTSLESITELTSPKEDSSASSQKSRSDSDLVIQNRDVQSFRMSGLFKRTFEDEKYQRTYSSLSRFTNRPKSM